MTNSDQAKGWDGVERRAGGNNPRRVAVVFSWESSRKDRSDPYAKRLSYPNNPPIAAQAASAAPGVAEV